MSTLSAISEHRPILLKHLMKQRYILPVVLYGNVILRLTLFSVYPQYFQQAQVVGLTIQIRASYILLYSIQF